MRKLVILFTAASLLFSCGLKTGSEKELTLEDGNGEMVKVTFTCEGCAENISSKEELNMIVLNISYAIKVQQDNPLSYVPISIKMKVEPVETVYYYYGNERIPNLLKVAYSLSYHVKDASGVEKEETSVASTHVSNMRTVDLEKDVKLPDITLREGKKGMYWASREMTLYSAYSAYGDDGYLTVVPLFYLEEGELFLKIISSIECVDKHLSVFISVIDGKTYQQIVLRNILEPNCKGDIIVELNQDDLNILASDVLKMINIYQSDEEVVCRVPKNQSDYFLQLIKLAPQNK